MKKCLRSVEKLSTGNYEYLRVHVTEAKEMVETKRYIFISKEEYKRKSKFYKLIPTEGTLINTKDEDGYAVQKCLNNLNFNKDLDKYPNSTKISKSSKYNPAVSRKNKSNIGVTALKR